MVDVMVVALVPGGWKTKLPTKLVEERVVRELASVDALIETMETTIPTEEGLRALVDAGPWPEVRTKVLEVWLLHARGPPRGPDLRRWAAGDDRRALVVAEALGEAGVPFLLEALERSPQPLLVALLLSRLGGPSARVESVWLEALATPGAEVIEALGRVGGKASVALLREVRGQLAAEAREAVGSIQ